jgi:sulfur carrier protein ThiS adenylyltransferase
MPQDAFLSQSTVSTLLCEKSVGIVGLGGLGSNVAMMLVRSGVCRLVLADFDRVEASNCNRQLYYPDQLNRLKTEALAETLIRIEPALELTLITEHLDRDNLVPLFGHVDVLIEAVDTAEEKSVLVHAATELLPDTPLVWAMGLAGYRSANLIETNRVGDNLWVVGDLEADVRSGLPLLASRVMVAAAHEAHMAVRIMLGMSDA